MASMVDVSHQQANECTSRAYSVATQHKMADIYKGQTNGDARALPANPQNRPGTPRQGCSSLLP